MKTKLVKILALSACLAGVSQAATITVSAGVGTANGLTVSLNGVVTTNQYLSVGSWNAATSTFTQFASTNTDTGTINGSFVGTSPSGVNNQVIHLYVSTETGISFDASKNWVLYRTSVNTAFPSDVSSTLASATATFSNFTTAIEVANSTSYTESGTKSINFVPVPEASAALLGAIGALGLLRRRRN